MGSGDFQSNGRYTDRFTEAFNWVRLFDRICYCDVWAGYNQP